MPNRFPGGSPLVEIFHALSDGTRLAVVERLSIGPASTTELSRPFAMALPSFLQHLGVLERSGIVMSHKSGRTRVYQLVPDGLAAAASWLTTHRSHWERRLDQLEQMLLAPPNPPNPPTSTTTTRSTP